MIINHSRQEHIYIVNDKRGLFKGTGELWTCGDIAESCGIVVGKVGRFDSVPAIEDIELSPFAGFEELGTLLLLTGLLLAPLESFTTESFASLFEDEFAELAEVELTN